MPVTPSRRIQVALLPSHVAELAPRDHTAELPTAGQSAVAAATAVVIDTLRFTTTACQALDAGAACVHVAASVTEAQQLASQLDPRRLLCGERHCHLIPGFDLGNSPLEFTPSTVAGRELVFTTTNGTRAIAAAGQWPRIWLAALVNRRAVCQQLIGDGGAGDVLLVCAGTDGQLTWEDVLTAGSLSDLLLASGSFRLGHDAARLAHAAWQAVAGGKPNAPSASQLVSELSQALGGQNLLTAGYERDLHFAAQLDSLQVVPQNSPACPHVFRHQATYF